MLASLSKKKNGLNHIGNIRVNMYYLRLSPLMEEQPQ